jgi:peptidoglycan-associated lipoprotein
MKAIGFVTLTALGVTLSLVTTGCHPENMSTIHGRPAPIAVDVNPRGPIITTLPPISDSYGTNSLIPLGDQPGHTNWTPHPEILKDYSVHFAFDSSAVRSSDKSKVASVADYLKNNPNVAVRVEGNCDERGTEEYNRSLGERRALAGREELIRLGIASDRVDTLSYGEDKPASDGHNESAWKENRRDDFVVLTPPGQ